MCDSDSEHLPLSARGTAYNEHIHMCRQMTHFLTIFLSFPEAKSSLFSLCAPSEMDNSLKLRSWNLPFPAVIWLCFMPGFRVLHNSPVRRNAGIFWDSHVLINRPPSGGNSFEWCRNADVWCSLCAFGHCPQQNKESEPDNIITNDYMLFYWIDQTLVDFWLATWVSDIFRLSCITLHKFRLTISFAGFYSDMLYQSSNYVTIRSLNLYWNN